MQNWPKMTKNKIFQKFCPYSEFGIQWKFILLVFCLPKSHVKSQNALSQSDCRILKLVLSKEKKRKDGL